MTCYKTTKILILILVAYCLVESSLQRQSGIFREFEAALLSLQWMLLACLSLWCGTFLFLTFSRKDWPLVCLLLVAIAAYYIVAHAGKDALVLLAGVTLGKGTQFLLKIEKQKVESRKFLIGLIVLLTFSAWWHLEVAHNFYPGTRWTGLWNNPNIYGMLMGAGVVLAMGLFAKNLKSEKLKVESEGSDDSSPRPSPRWARRGGNYLRSLPLFAAIKSAIGNWQSAILLVAAGMMAVGLLFSYSRGAWLATAIGLLYLAWSYGKFKWWWVVIGVGCVALGAGLLWGRTADNGPWYLKRLDFSRPSAQHRVAAWRGALQIIRDHPLGVGWNQAVTTYDKNYSPPEGGAAALTMNSYLMLGTELGLPGLFCFVAYVGLCFRTNRRHLTPALSPFDPSAPVKRGEGEASSGSSAVVSTAGCGGVSPPVATLGGTPGEPADETSALRVACRAGAVVLLVAFWFDGGLFDLPTAAVFWVLLELGAERQKRKAESGRQFRHLTPALSPDEAEREPKSAIGNRQSAINQSLATSAATETRGFTLIELLVVIAIIGILAGLVMTATAHVKNKGSSVIDINNLKQMGIALNLYAGDNQDYLPWSNWLAGDQPDRHGWLYTPSDSVEVLPPGGSVFVVQTGVLWTILKNPKSYFCPLDGPNTPLFSQRAQQICSYVMNGAITGYGRTNYPPTKLGQMSPTGVVFWETDETVPSDFNDGASQPHEGVSKRHNNGAINSTFGGSVGFVRFTDWYQQATSTNKNELWCYPGSVDGH
jgi:prepilin-type N-terminal cleavage/methylation domain-containing protein